MEFHHNEYGKSWCFLFAIIIILLRMKPGIANLAEFTRVSTFVNEEKFTPWAKNPKQQLGVRGQWGQKKTDSLRCYQESVSLLCTSPHSLGCWPPCQCFHLNLEWKRSKWGGKSKWLDWKQISFSPPKNIIFERVSTTYKVASVNNYMVRDMEPLITKDFFEIWVLVHLNTILSTLLEFLHRKKEEH